MQGAEKSSGFLKKMRDDKESVFVLTVLTQLIRISVLFFLGEHCCQLTSSLLVAIAATSRAATNDHYQGS